MGNRKIFSFSDKYTQLKKKKIKTNIATELDNYTYLKKLFI